MAEKTKPRGPFRFGDEYDLAQAKAQRVGETMTDVMRRACRRYVAEEDNSELVDAILQVLKQHASKKEEKS